MIFKLVRRDLWWSENEPSIYILGNLHVTFWVLILASPSMKPMALVRDSWYSMN